MNAASRRAASGSCRRANPSDRASGARAAAVWVAAAALLALVAPRASLGQRYVPGPDAEHLRLKYGDSLVSINDRCMVTHRMIKPYVRPVYVSRQAVGFC